jgi:hypothetical protein
MFVRASTGWVPAGSSVNGTSQRYRYIATAGQTTFTGVDSNGNTLTYDAGFADIYLNGVRLDSTDFTASSGTSVVLASGAALNDELNIVAFGTFNVASFNGSGLIDNTTNISKLNATGTRNASTFLAGDNTFKTVAVTPTAVSDQNNTSTGYFDLPSGTTAERPGSPTFGMIRANTSTGIPEWYDASSSAWKPFSQGISYSTEYLVVAGGGGGGGVGGSYAAGGGGAGGYLADTLLASVGGSYSITIGAGGNGGTGGQRGFNGSDSSLSTLAVAIGGGGGGHNGVPSGISGGSGGGGTYSGGSAGAGTSGQGNAGGAGNSSNGTGAGGGGAGAAGTNVVDAEARNGGAGLNWQSLGTFYAGGGGGGNYVGTVASSGGNGGGGRGGYGTNTGGPGNGVSGTANTGGGGGGGGSNNSATTNGGSGGSGIVIIRYLGAQRGTGGTVTSSGGYTYHTFTSSGTFTA